MRKKWLKSASTKRKKFKISKKYFIFIIIFILIGYFFLSYILIRTFENDLNLYEKLKNLTLIDKFNKKFKKTRINIYNYVEPKICNKTCFGENGEAVILNVILINLEKIQF
jgi:hypothetical protein